MIASRELNKAISIAKLGIQNSGTRAFFGIFYIAFAQGDNKMHEIYEEKLSRNSF